MRKYRAGDVVKHNPSGETWTLATDEEDGRVYWCGWPPDGSGMASDCTLVEGASLLERIDTLRRVSKSRGDHGEVFGITLRARQTLHREKLCDKPCAICTDDRAASPERARARVVEAACAHVAERCINEPNCQEPLCAAVRALREVEAK